jgi:prolyl oligopeptidase
MTIRLRSTVAAVVLVALGIVPVRAQEQQGSRLAYPTPKTGSTVDDYFGTKISDPYRWMENLESTDVAEWVAAENALTTGYLQSLSMRDALKRRITELWNYPKVSIPFREGGRLFYRKNSGLERQSRVFVR